MRVSANGLTRPTRIHRAKGRPGTGLRTSGSDSDPTYAIEVGLPLGGSCLNLHGPSGLFPKPRPMTSSLIAFYIICKGVYMSREETDAFATRHLPHQLGEAQSPGAMANSLPPSKSIGPPPSLPSPSTSQSPAPQNDAASRRSGGASGFGAGASTRPAAAARNNQANKKQHKPRRPRMNYEDPAAENVSQAFDKNVESKQDD